MTRIIYYTTISAESPPRDFIQSLSAVQKAKISRVFMYIELYGLTTTIRHTKKLTGTPFWEIRILGQDSIRIIYVTVEKNAILVLHGLIKKSQKTPTREINTALDRLNEWNNRREKGA
jgi:phage-related protein